MESASIVFTQLNQAGHVLVISPHLDDAVFSCEALLRWARDVTVFTVFSGDTKLGASLSEWDRLCGFSEGDDVMAHRRQEDMNALNLVGATALWGELSEATLHSEALDEEAVRRALIAAIDKVQPTHIVFPLGLSHEDHLTVSQECLSVLSHTAAEAFTYAERPYSQRAPWAVRRRRTELTRLGWELESVHLPRGHRRSHLEGIRCYQTQLRGLKISALRLGLYPESYWKVSKAPFSKR